MISDKKSPDIHEDPPKVSIYVNKAGISSLYIDSNIRIGESCHNHAISLNIYTDLPANKKGVHLSRLVNSAISELNGECRRIEELLSRIAEKAVYTHEYSNFVEIEANISIPHNGQLISVSFGVKREKSSEEKWKISIEMMGATSCPCAKEVFRFFEGTEWSLTPTHMQRATVKAILTDSTSPYTIEEAFELIDTIDSSFSGSFAVSLSRDEEKDLIKKIINNPMFAEDLAREIAWRVSQTPAGKKAKEIITQINSLESIHPFNVFAEVHIHGKEFRD